MNLVIIDSDPRLIEGLSVSLERRASQVKVYTALSVREAMRAGFPEPAMVLHAYDGPTGLAAIRQRWPEATVVLLCTQNEDFAPTELFLGGDFVIEKPFNPGRIASLATLIQRHPNFRLGTLALRVQSQSWTSLQLKLASPMCRAEDIAPIVGADLGLTVAMMVVASATQARSQSSPTISGLIARIGVERIARLARDPRTPGWFGVSDDAPTQAQQHAVQAACDAYDYVNSKPESALAYAIALLSYANEFQTDGSLTVPQLLEVLDAPASWVSTMNAVHEHSQWGDPIVAAVVAARRRAAQSTRTRRHKTITVNLVDVA
ncbi:MAG: hypothetical protein R3E66_18140 [bacterium]